MIAVKRETGGRGGSINLIDATKQGDELLVSDPRNISSWSRRRSNIFIAGGIGITPILSMIRHIRATGQGKFKLYYLSRSAEMTAFLDELKGPSFAAW